MGKASELSPRYFKGLSSLAQTAAHHMALMAWGSGSVADWEARASDSQRLSDLRRAQATRAQQRRSERLREALIAGLALGFVLALGIIVALTVD